MGPGLWSLAACTRGEHVVHGGPCPPFAETRVVDEVGIAGDLVAAELALDEFATWTALDGACVSEIRIVERPFHPSADGTYLSEERRIEVRAGNGRMRHVVQHELCHALDRSLGDVSLDHPDLFPTQDPSHAAAGVVEEFGDSCAIGPAAARLADAFGACRVDGPDPRWGFLSDEVFTGDPGGDALVPLDPVAQPLDVDPTFHLDSPQAGVDGSLWLRTLHLGGLAFARVDGATGEFAGLLGPPVSKRESVDWYGGTGDPLVVAWQPSVGAAAFRATAAGAVRVPFPEDLSALGGGAVLGQTLYAWTAVGPFSRFRIDLETGTYEEEPSSSLTSVGATPDAFLTVEYGPKVRLVADDGSELAITPPAESEPTSGLPLDRGRALVQLRTTEAAVLGAVAGTTIVPGASEDERWVLATFGDDEGWRFSPTPCEGLGDQGWARLGDEAVTLDELGTSLLRFPLPARR